MGINEMGIDKVRINKVGIDKVGRYPCHCQYSSLDFQNQKSLLCASTKFLLPCLNMRHGFDGNQSLG